MLFWKYVIDSTKCTWYLYTVYFFKKNLLVSLSVSVNTNDVTLFVSDRQPLKETHPSGWQKYDMVSGSIKSLWSSAGYLRSNSGFYNCSDDKM